LISIRKAASDLDRMEELLQSAQQCYSQAIRSTAQYAIELDAADASEFRVHLGSVEKQMENAQGADDWSAVQASFRGELRVYRDKAAGQLERLYQQIKASTETVQLFTESVAAIDVDHEARIQGVLGELGALEQSADVGALHAGIRAATQTIGDSMIVMRRRHQAGIAELRDEIRALHKQIESEHKAKFLDPATGVWNRRKLDMRIADLVEHNQPFCILLICVRNLPRLDRRDPQIVIEGAMKALIERLTKMLEEGAVIGRWDEQNFAAILEMEAAAAIRVSQVATQKLAGEYPVQENGLSRNILLEATAGVIDRFAGSDEISFQQKLLQMSQALSGS
jgi:GGDEF domain-containing protein